MKVALIQLRSMEDKNHNIQKASKMVLKAAAGKAGFVLLPEVFSCRTTIKSRSALKAVSEDGDGPTVSFFRSLAKKEKIFLLLGSLLERDPSGSKVFNTSFLIGPNGSVIAKYRKMNLFKAKIGTQKIDEGIFFRSGQRPVSARVAGFLTGLSICYDLRFPELYRGYSHQGVHAITVPSCFTKKTGSAHWEVLLRARAIENQCFVLAPNQVGTDARGVEAYGHSMIVDPWGRVIARGSADKEEIVTAEISKKTIDAYQKILPSIRTVR